jgi:hypothetical protein
MVSWPGGVSAQSAEEFRREAGAALGIQDVVLQWRDLSSASGSEAFDRIVVIRFRGACAADESASKKAGALGITHVSNGRILPFIEMDCPRVANSVNRRFGRVAPLFRELALGRALGRVAAHEIYHVLAGSEQHDEVGVSKPSFDHADLFDGELKLNAEAASRIRASLQGQLHRNTGTVALVKSTE